MRSGGCGNSIGEPAKRVLVQDGHVTGIATAKATYPADAVIATVPVGAVGGGITSLGKALLKV